MLALALAALSSAYLLAVEPNHTTIAFSVPVASGITRVTGKFNRFEVELVYDAEDVSSWTVQASIDAASIDTGNDERDEDLQGEAFFDVARHPRIRFESDRIETSEDGYLARGTLTIRGRSRPLDLPFRVTGVEWIEGAPIVGIASEILIDRNAFGVGTDWRHSLIPNFIGDEVAIEIFLWTKPGKLVDREKERCNP